MISSYTYSEWKWAGLEFSILVWVQIEKEITNVSMGTDWSENRLKVPDTHLIVHQKIAQRRNLLVDWSTGTSKKLFLSWYSVCLSNSQTCTGTKIQMNHISNALLKLIQPTWQSNIHSHRFIIYYDEYLYWGRANIRNLFFWF